MTNVFSEIAANLVADFASKGLEAVGAPTVDKVRDALFERSVMIKVVCKLCTGFEDLEEAEHVEEALLVVDRRFFALPGVRDAFLGYLATGEVDQSRIRRVYSSIYGSERLDDFERNLAEAISIFERELNEALDPAGRAAFARVRHAIGEGFKSLEADLDESTRAILTQQAQTHKEILEVGENVRQVERTMQDPSTLWRRIDLSGEYEAQLEQIRALLQQFQTRLALDQLTALKERIWDKASPANRNRILTLMGFAYLQMDEKSRAAEMLINALSFSPESARSLANAALGHLLQGDIERSRELAEAARAEDPLLEFASAVLVYASPADEPWESVIGNIPPVHRDKVDVAMAVGKIASERGLLKETEQWYRVAVRCDSVDHPDPKGKLADVLLTQLLASRPEQPMPGLVHPETSSLKEILALYDSAWEEVAHTDLRGHRLGWLINRATVRALLGDTQGAIHDLDQAYQDRPSDVDLIRQRGLLAYQTGDLATAAAMFRELQGSDETGDADFWLGLVLFEDGRRQQAQSLIEEYVEQIDTTDRSWKDAVYALALIKLGFGDIAGAGLLANRLREEFQDDPGVLALCARVASHKGQSEESERLLRDAIDQVTVTTRFVTRYRLVDELCAGSLFSEAASLLETMVNTDIDEQPTRQLLICYYQSGNLGPALEICRRLRKRYGPLKFATQMESAIYEEIGEIEQAKQLCNQYLELFPDDATMKLRFAAVSYRLEQFDDVDSVLDSDLDTAEFSLQAYSQLAQLYLLRDRHKEALEVAYEARRRFIDQPDAHLAYVSIFLRSADHLSEWLEAEVVGIDTAVQLDRPIAAGQSWIVIESNRDAAIKRGEFPPSHTLVESLLGKREGESASIPSTLEIGTQEYTVENIRSKFVYAWHESLDAYTNWFPGVPGIWRGQFKTSPNGEVNAQSFRPLFKMLDHIDQRQEQGMQLYRERKRTIGSLALVLGENPILTWKRLVAKPDVGVYCFSGKGQELGNAVAILQSGSRIIVDITSLLTIHSLEIGDSIVTEFGNPGVLRSTLELIENLLAQEITLGKEHLRIGKEGDHYFKNFVTQELIDHNRRVLTSLQAWAEANCEILSWRAALNIPRNERLHLGEVFGQTFFDTMLVAAEEDLMLYSDDGLLRALAKNEYQVAGLWTQAALEHLRQKGVISKDAYNKAVVRLAGMNYHHTSINKEILLEAARMADWLPRYPFLHTLRMLGGTQSNMDLAVNVAARFTYSLWKKRIIPDAYENLVFSLLDGLTADRGMEKAEAIRKFLAVVEQQFVLAPLEITRLRNLARTWLQIHIV